MALRRVAGLASVAVRGPASGLRLPGVGFGLLEDRGVEWDGVRCLFCGVLGCEKCCIFCGEQVYAGLEYLIFSSRLHGRSGLRRRAENRLHRS